MIGATDQEAVSGMANVKRARNVSSSSGEDEEGEEEEDDDDDDGEKRRNRGAVEDEEEDDDNVDEDNGVTAFREKLPEWMSMIDSGIKLSGPVTDL